MQAKRLSIKYKLLAFALVLPTALAVIYGIIAISSMDKIGTEAINSNEIMSEEISKMSANVLTNRVMEQALTVARSQADLSNNVFSNIESIVKLLQFSATLAFENPEKLKFKPSYTRENKPADIATISIYHLPPDTEVSPEIQKYIDISSTLDDLISYICLTDPNLESLYIGFENGLHRSYRWRGGRFLPDNFDPRKRSWYKAAAKKRSLGWSELYVDALSGELVLSCYIPIISSDNKLIGVIGADVLLKSINDDIINAQLYGSGKTFLLDKDGKLIAAEGISSQGKNWDEELDTKIITNTDDPKMKQLLSEIISGEPGVQIANTENYGKIVIAYAPLKSLGWTLAVIHPLNDIIQPALDFKERIDSYTSISKNSISHSIFSSVYQLVSIFAVIIIVAIILALKFSKRLTKPILELNNDVRKIGKGDFQAKLHVDTGDEIEELAEAFNQMTSDLKEHIDDLQRVTSEKEKISSELTIAREIQHSILPKLFPPFPNRCGLDIFAALESAKEVGGDLYDFMLLDDDHLYICIGDVSGKGVPASLFMAVGKTLLKSTIQRVQDPAKALFHVNNELNSGNDACMFITLFCGIFNLRTNELTYSNAGHNPPLIISDEDATFLDFAKAPPLAIMEDIEYHNQTITLDYGCKFLMYTDGVTEAMNASLELYSEERLVNFLKSNPCKTAEKCISMILKDIALYASEAEQSDDITLICFSYRPTENSDSDTLSPTTTLVLTNHKGEMQRLITWLDEITAKLNWSHDFKTELNMIFEEWIINLISYAFPNDDSVHEIEIHLWQEESSIKIEISDDGIEFDPTVIPTPDINAPLEERKIGGLGIHFIRETTEAQAYKREYERNTLTLTKKLK